ncbi:hypothetical protein LguiB_035865 [Lonicera macranthoides]
MLIRHMTTGVILLAVLLRARAPGEEWDVPGGPFPRGAQYVELQLQHAAPNCVNADGQRSLQVRYPQQPSRLGREASNCVSADGQRSLQVRYPQQPSSWAASERVNASGHAQPPTALTQMGSAASNCVTPSSQVRASNRVDAASATACGREYRGEANLRENYLCPVQHLVPPRAKGGNGWSLFWEGRDESERRRAESQWIVAARPLCHLQYPVAYLSRLQRILPAARWKLYFKAARAARPPRGLSQRHVPLGARGPLLLVGKRAAGACVASSPDSDLEAFSHNPAHAHVPYWWVNNPTLGEFCFTMIGRADIEGSKSNVAMNAWLPQASYPCGNFSDTSSFKFRRSKGSLGHAFTVRIRTGNQNQTSFYPSVPHEISVLVELILGHLRYLLTDVPPQPNSPPDNVFRPDRPAEASLGSKKRGCAPLPIHGIRSSFPADSAKPVPLAVVSLDSRQGHRIPLVRTSSESTVRRPGKAPEGAVPSPSPGRHAATRSRRGSSSSSPPTADGFGTGTPVPSPQSQSFSRGYGSILPTSLAYIVPSTRGCSPWRPDAVMSTTGRGRHSVLRIFKGRRGRTGHHATCGALPAAGPYLRLSRFQGGQAVKQKR